MNTDNNHCGACGRKCATGTSCSGGSCVKAVSYKTDVAPIWSRCICHTSRSPGGVSLASHAAFVGKTGNSTKIIVKPGDVAGSNLVTRITSTSNPMPPGGSLTAKQINTIKTWITQGAKNN
jgi:hypothetical protein